MEHKIKIKGRAYSFIAGELEDIIDVDKEISIDYSNLAGDSYVTPLTANAVGNMKADLEYEVNKKKLDISIYEVDFKKDKRRLGAKSGEKVTEKALETLHCGEQEWQDLQNELFILEASLKKVENLYWRLQHKLDKLNMYHKEVLPADFADEVIEKALKKSAVISVGGLSN